ncbi:FecR family protein [Sunxiuqinia sp. A32]|uniref:FecR family protein n=1 Tax=Sunxiuqinia sp. A32 TaxID=3461496 RepID=UPI004045591B
MENFEKDRIRKYFSDPSNKDEDFISASFYKKENENELEEIARDQWQKTKRTQVELQHVLNDIHFKINTTRKDNSVTKRILSIYTRVAAVFLIPILLAGIYFYSQQMVSNQSFAEIRAPKGSRVQFTLPDGSKGYLNSKSVLKYGNGFNNDRTLYLKGEAYLEVKKDKKHPFTVNTKHTNVIVTGTSFDICAYEEDDDIMVTLEEGSVQVLNKLTNKIASLSPGYQSLVDSRSGDMQINQVDTKLYTSWKEEILRFDETPFYEVVKKMERWYGVKIIVDDQLKVSGNYTLTIKTESLRELFQLLSITTPMKYKIENDTVYVYPR